MLQRLKDIRKSLGFTQIEFARHLGITQTAYSMIENGIRPLSDKYIQIICITFSVSKRFLISGEGEMFQVSPYEKELLEIFDNLVPETQDYLLVVAKELLEMQETLVTSFSPRGVLPFTISGR